MGNRQVVASFILIGVGFIGAFVAAETSRALAIFCIAAPTTIIMLMPVFGRRRAR